MNLLGRKVWLPVLAASFFVGCEDPGEIGIKESVPTPFDVKYIDVPLNPAVAYIDSVGSTNTQYLLFGNYSDPNFGTIKSTAYMELAITEIDFEIPETSIFDSLVLFMDINYAYGPNTEAVMFMEVRTFTGNILTATYFTKDSIPTPTGLGPNTGLLGARNRSYDPESTSTFFFKLNDPYGEQLLQNMITDIDSTFRNQEYFRQYLSGIKVFSTNINGGIFGFNPISDSSRLSLFYHYFDEEGEQVDEEYQWRVRRGFSNVRSDFSGTPFENLPQPYTDFTPSGDLAYHNPSLGLFLKLDLAGLHAFRDTAENVIVNRADLILDIDESLAFDPPEQIRYYQINDENRFILSDIDSIPRSLQIESPNYLFRPTQATDPFVFGYDSLNNRFSEQITFFVKNIMSEKLADSALVVLSQAPARDVTKSNLIYYPRIHSVDQFVIPKNNIKLRLYYSKFE